MTEGLFMSSTWLHSSVGFGDSSKWTTGDASGAFNLILFYHQAVRHNHNHPALA